MGDKYTEAQKRASIKYLAEKTESIQIRVPKGHKEILKSAAAARGLSLNQLIIQLMERELAERP